MIKSIISFTDLFTATKGKVKVGIGRFIYITLGTEVDEIKHAEGPRLGAVCG